MLGRLRSVLALALITAALGPIGCHGPIAPSIEPHEALRRVPLVGRRLEQEQLRREVEGDAFPSADQVGL